jgi:hypothetical protein
MSKGTKYLNEIHTGDKFGSWEVVGSPCTDDKGRAKVGVRCLCGKEADVYAYKLVKGKSTQCSDCARGATLTLNALHTRTYRSAAARDINYDITSEEVSESFALQEETCAVTGEVLTEGSSTLVRLTHSEGFTVENSVFVTNEVANIMAASGKSANELKSWAINIAQVPRYEPKKRKSTKEFLEHRENE